MELRQIRYAAAVAEHGTIRAAARQLHIAPQSLTQQLDVLEREMAPRCSGGTAPA